MLSLGGNLIIGAGNVSINSQVPGNIHLGAGNATISNKVAGNIEAGAGGPALRRMLEGCQPVEESLRYEAYVGERALAILSWTDPLPDHAGQLKVLGSGRADGHYRGRSLLR